MDGADLAGADQDQILDPTMTPELAAEYQALAARFQAHEALPDGRLAARAWILAMSETNTEDYTKVDDHAAQLLLDCVARGQAL
jgi:hypothetical protein